MTDKMRSEFEEWARPECFDLTAVGGFYSDNETDAAYKAWQACAARMVPEGFVVVPKEILDRFPEINPSNYGHDDACELNAWGVELCLSAAPAQEKV